jgi:hypothetical protein
MPDYAPDATPRYKVIYRSAGFQHTWLFRSQRGSSASTNIANGRAAAAGLAAALEELLPEDFEFQAEYHALQDTDIFLPTGFLPANPAGATPVASYTPVMRGTGTVFSGRGGASKARITAFGVFWDQSNTSSPADNGLVTTGESVDVAAAITFLATATGLRSISNEPITWYPRVTVKQNDVYVKLARRLFP